MFHIVWFDTDLSYTHTLDFSLNKGLRKVNSCWFYGYQSKGGGGGGGVLAMLFFMIYNSSDINIS